MDRICNFYWKNSPNPPQNRDFTLLHLISKVSCNSFFLKQILGHFQPAGFSVKVIDHRPRSSYLKQFMLWLDLIFNIFFATVSSFCIFHDECTSKNRMLFFYETLNMFVASGFKVWSNVPGRKTVDAKVTNTGITVWEGKLTNPKATKWERLVPRVSWDRLRVPKT